MENELILNGQLLQAYSRADSNTRNISLSGSEKANYAQIHLYTGEIVAISREDLVPALRSGILADAIHPGDSIKLTRTMKDGTPRIETIKLIDFVKREFSLRILLQPVWSYSVAWLKWGLLIGVAFQIITLELPFLWIPGLVSILGGGVLGAMTGMIIGGVIGLIRRDPMNCARDLSAEPSPVIVKSIILPSIGSAALLVLLSVLK